MRGGVVVRACVCYECWLSVVHGCVCLGRVKGGLAHSSGGVACVLQGKWLQVLTEKDCTYQGVVAVNPEEPARSLVHCV
jgi:hypothetical protein